MTTSTTFEQADVEAGRLGDLVPALHVRFPPSEAERLKRLAATLGEQHFKGRFEPKFWERLCRLRWALDAWTGRPLTNDPPPELLRMMAFMPLGGKRLDLRTRRHHELQDSQRRGSVLRVFQPLDRVREAEPDAFVIAGSVLTNPDGSSSVFVWGAMEHVAVVEACRAQPERRASAVGLPPHKGGPPLADFDGELLRRLVGGNA
jgi:hypothetical protein